MAVIADVIEGNLTLTQTGWTDQRVFIVSGVGGDRAARKYVAATTSGVPRRGDAHPGGVPGVSVQTISVAPESGDNTIFRVTVDYSGDTEGTAEGLEGTGVKGLEISTSTITKTTIRDINGNLLLVTYEGPSFQIRQNSVEQANNVSILSTSGILTAEYEISVARAVVTVERSIPSLTEHHRTKNSVNASQWSGDPATQWLVLGVDSSITSNGRHDWRYQLAHAAEGWDFRGEINQISGVLPADASQGNGFDYFPLYRRLDFGTLGFEIPR